MIPRNIPTLTLLFALALLGVSQAQEAAEMNEAEQAFSDMMANATLDGRNIPIVDGALGQAGGDKYKIVSATKVKDDQWIITYHAKMQGQVVPLPIPVTVQWAGDTAVLSVNNLRGYSARVLFYDNSYAGTWSGATNGGLISGIITQE